MIKNKIFLLFILVYMSCGLADAQSQATRKDFGANGNFVVENYYKVKWGFADEFIGLWKTNHYPLLKKAIEKGDIISVSASTPKLHSGEDTRWDFRVIIVFKDAVAAFDPNLTTPYKAILYPDQESLKKAEQHRFELLIAHWDIETSAVQLN
jgi:hypothetical protein